MSRRSNQPPTIDNVVVGGPYSPSHAEQFRSALPQTKKDVLFRLREDINYRRADEGDDALALPVTSLAVLISLLVGLLSLQLGASANATQAVQNVRLGLKISAIAILLWALLAAWYAARTDKKRAVTAVLVARLAAYEDVIGVFADGSSCTGPEDCNHGAPVTRQYGLVNIIRQPLRQIGNPDGPPAREARP